MLKEHNRFFLISQVIFDAVMVSLAWFATVTLSEKGYITENPGKVAINIGEEGLLFGLNVTTQRLDLSLFSYAHLLVLIGCLYCFERSGLYRSFRNIARFGDLKHIVRGLAYFIFPAWAISTMNPHWHVSIAFACYFIGICLLTMLIMRFFERQILRRMRSKGFNQRHLLVVGAGRLGQDLVQRIQRCRWMGFHVIGYLDNDVNLLGKSFFNTPVIGNLDQLESILNQKKVDQVYCTLPFNEMDNTSKVAQVLEKTTADLRIVPDMMNIYTLHTSLFEIDGLPVLGVRETPLQGFSILQKRIFDIIFSSCALILLSPVYVAIAILVKLSSKGPIFYKQKRMSYDGTEFNILKFRSMPIDVEAQSGPTWASEGDNRATAFGSFLRKSSLDELPQFLNVFLGQMSVVGPRPERPEFIDQFKHDIPRYMLRHKTKAGVTGWAQVNGWRGSTSLKKRIQYDLYYIENWSIWFDIRIVFDTVFKGFFNKNAY